jgi:signal transduction histidine kinase
VLLLLATAALAYAPTLSPRLNLANVLVLAPTLLWTLAQYLLFYRRGSLPGWLAVVNPLVDITAVTAIIGGYALAQAPALAFKSPIWVAYFVILAGRPIASSARKAAAVAVLAVAEYGALLTAFVAAGRLALVESPLVASVSAYVAPLDEGAKLLLLAVAGAVATYATAWHEQVATSYSRELRERARMETQLAQAQLRSLKLQLQPHFLFNTLNTITALITVDPRRAEQVISELSELLRLSLHNSADQEVPLERELEMLQPYLTIQQIRFEDRLTVDVHVAPEARDALVPNFILQPLVENAIRHGLAPRAAAGRVEVSARRDDGSLRLVVRDDGVGVHAAGGPAREGVGLGNTRERLRRLYGARHRLEIRSAPGAGFTVDIAIPFHRQPMTAGEAGEPEATHAPDAAERTRDSGPGTRGSSGVLPRNAPA